MAIVREKIGGWVLDELKFYAKVYEDTLCNYKTDLYKIDEPFRMQSQIDSLKRQNLLNETVKLARKRSRPASVRFEVDNELGIICKITKQKFTEYVESASELFSASKSVEQLDNNQTARDASKLCSMLNIVVKYGSCWDISRLKNEQALDSIHANCIYKNNLPSTVKIVVSQERFMIPAHSQFIVGNVRSGLQFLIKELNKFDLIIIDPPWENKSMMNEQNFCELPIEEVLNENSVLALWVTNNVRLQKFVKEVMFKKWNLHFYTEWIWMKSTTSGEPVCEFRPDFKMPFEVVFIGGKSEDCAAVLSERRFLLSVPCAVPSRKVPLQDLFKQYLPNNFSTLELFARNLLSNATSVGDEVLKMQNEKCFKFE